MDYIANNAQDFGLYFNTCYVGKPRKESQGFDVYKIHSREREDLITLTSWDGKTKLQESWKAIVEDWSPVPRYVGMTNVGKTICYISRFPRQQVKKGFTTDGNYSFWYPHSLLMDNNKLPKINFAELAEAVFNNKYFKPEELLDLLDKGERVGGALSRHFGVYILPDFETPILGYKNSCIGSVIKGIFTVAKPYGMYSDVLARDCEGIKIKVME